MALSVVLNPPTTASRGWLSPCHVGLGSVDPQNVVVPLNTLTPNSVVCGMRDECPGDSWWLVVRPGSIVRHSCPSLCVVCWTVSPWRWMWQFLSSCVKWVRWDIQRRNRGYAETRKLNTSELCVLQQPDDINKSGAEIACSLADANQFHWNCLLFLSWILISQTVSHSYSLSDKNLSSTMKQFCLLKHFI